MHARRMEPETTPANAWTALRPRLRPVAERVRLRMSPGSAYDLREVTGIKRWSLDAAGGSIDIPALFVAWRKSMNITEGRRGGPGLLFHALLKLQQTRVLKIKHGKTAHQHIV